MTPAADRAATIRSSLMRRLVESRTAAITIMLRIGRLPMYSGLTHWASSVVDEVAQPRMRVVAAANRTLLKRFSIVVLR